MYMYRQLIAYTRLEYYYMLMNNIFHIFIIIFYDL